MANNEKRKKREEENTKTWLSPEQKRNKKNIFHKFQVFCFGEVYKNIGNNRYSLNHFMILL